MGLWDTPPSFFLALLCPKGNLFNSCKKTTDNVKPFSDQQRGRYCRYSRSKSVLF